jgi:hypothetical protein
MISVALSGSTVVVWAIVGRQSGVRSGQARSGQSSTAVGSSPIRTDKHGGRVKPDPDNQARRSGQARSGQTSTAVGSSPIRTIKHGDRGKSDPAWVVGRIGLDPTVRSFGVLRSNADRSVLLCADRVKCFIGPQIQYAVRYDRRCGCCLF